MLELSSQIGRFDGECGRCAYRFMAIMGAEELLSWVVVVNLNRVEFLEIGFLSGSEIPKREAPWLP